MKNYFTKITLLFIAFMVLLAVCVSFIFTNDNHFDNESAYNLVSLLSENGVIIDEQLIDTKTQYVMNTELKSITSDKATLSKNILGDDVSVLADAYTSPLGTITFTGSEFNFKPAKEYREDITKDAGKFDANKKAEKLLQSLDFNLDGSNISNTEEDSTIKVTVTKTIEGLPVFNDTLYVSMNKLGTTSIIGRWYSNAGALKYKRASKSIVDASIELMQTKSENMEIANIQLGYLLKDTSSDISILRPVWQFTTADGDIVYIDA